MTEILFYHLTERTLVQVLPGLIEKSLSRGWKVVVQLGSQAQLETMDEVLWTWRKDAFMPHGKIGDGHEERQPVWLTMGDENPNNANIRFLVDGADIDETSFYERVVYMFDGHDNVAVEHARERWKFHKAQEEVDQTYWQQNPNGGWEKKAG